MTGRKPRPLLDRASVAPDTPLRLEDAMHLTFPDGTTTVAALRREIAAGRLVAWRVGGRHLTSLVEIERMLERCRVKPKEQGSGSGNVRTAPAERSDGAYERMMQRLRSGGGKRPKKERKSDGNRG